jgi:hypothetical protein
MSSNGNGSHELPPPREAVVEQGLRIHQETAAERDDLRRRLSERETDIAGFKVAIEALQAQLAEAESRVATMTLVRDQAVADRAVYETLFISIQAQLRAFKVPAAPLIKEADTVGE